MKVGEFESGVPVAEGKWAFLRRMVVGQSCFVEGVERTAITNAAVRNLGKGAYRIKKEESGFRIWRIQ